MLAAGMKGSCRPCKSGQPKKISEEAGRDVFPGISLAAAASWGPVVPWKDSKEQGKGDVGGLAPETDGLSGIQLGSGATPGSVCIS